MFYTGYPVEKNISSFMYTVYAWMAAALSITAVTAYAVAVTPWLFTTIYSNPPLLIVLFIAQIGLVVWLSAGLMRMSFTTAVALFLLYAFSVGVTFSALFYLYTMESLFTTFLSSAAMFGGMAAYGYITKTDLSGVGSVAIMMLWGLIISSLVNIWFANQMFDFVISIAGIVIFSLLTAYDMQKIKRIAQELVADDETIAKVSVIGALTLYLDFINLFLYLLRFLGKKRE